jgi:uncharacterized protein (TIGR02444 family)
MSPALDNPLWTFALAVYGARGVADECLALQERLHLDVNLLLSVAHAGAVEGRQLDKQDIAVAAEAVAIWHGEIVRGLRQARRALKPFSIDENHPLRKASTALRKTVKVAELEAEKIELAMLWDWSRAQIAGRERGDQRTALIANLRTLLGYYGAPAAQAEPMNVMPRLCDAAMACAASAFDAR